MSQKTFIQFAGALFALKAVFGLIYIFWGWKATIAGWEIPNWLILIAIAVDSYLAYVAAKLTKFIK